ncbi:MAG TPA: hypothetical protein V6C93_21295 [Allocoleopsis sp.]
MNVLIPAGLPPCWRFIPSRQPTSSASVSLKIRLAQSLELINITPILGTPGRTPSLRLPVNGSGIDGQAFMVSDRQVSLL